MYVVVVVLKLYTVYTQLIDERLQTRGTRHPLTMAAGFSLSSSTMLHTNHPTNSTRKNLFSFVYTSQANSPPISLGTIAKTWIPFFHLRVFETYRCASGVKEIDIVFSIGSIRHARFNFRPVFRVVLPCVY